MATEHRAAWRRYRDVKPRKSASSFRPALSPRPICSLSPQSQSFSTELCTTAKCLNAGCTALLIIQFVAKHLPIWHIWCSSHLFCLNWSRRRRSCFNLQDGVIFSSFQMLACCFFFMWWGCGGHFLQEACSETISILLSSVLFLNTASLHCLSIHLITSHVSVSLHLLNSTHVFDKHAGGTRGWSLSDVN